MKIEFESINEKNVRQAFKVEYELKKCFNLDLVHFEFDVKTITDKEDTTKIVPTLNRTSTKSYALTEP